MGIPKKLPFGKTITAAVKQFLPGFERLHGELNQDSHLIFVYKPNSQVSVFLRFYKWSNRRQRFHIDCGWSINHHFPQHLLGIMSLRNDPHSEIKVDSPVDGEFLFRINQLIEGDRNDSFRTGSTENNEIEKVIQHYSKPLMDYINQIDPERPGGWSERP